ncbi:MAG: hypothetical protein V4508_19445 [Pseudomonadota bacterium]
MNSKLPDALLDAQLLLTHAARDGAALDPKMVATIVESDALISSGAITAAKETEFWLAFDALSKLLCPVTVSSLRATMDSHTKIKPAMSKLRKWLGLGFGSDSLARRAVRAYTVLTVVAVLVLLSVQIYWLFGVTVTQDLAQIKQTIGVNKGKISQLNEARILARANPKAVRSEAALTSDLTILDSEKANLDVEQGSSFNMLEIWSSLWEGDRIVRRGCAQNSPDDHGKIVACEKIARMQAAGVVLNNLKLYLLPLLYGFLGACAYTLRTLTAQIRTRTYSDSSNIDFRIRLCLGTLGGIVSAWFLSSPTEEGAAKSISPFALAFLAGYSIELVFSAMDRVMSAFTKTSQ